MAKTTPDMIIQLNVSAPGLEAAITALTDAISKVSGGEVVIPTGAAMQIAGVEAVPAAEVTQPTSVASTPQPVPQPTPVTPAPQPVPQAAPTPQPVQQPAPVAPTPQPVPQAAPTAPQAVAPAPAQTQSITLETICNAGAKLVEQGQMNQVIQLLGKYGVQAVNQIKPEQFGAFATDLRALGAQI